MITSKELTAQLALGSLKRFVVTIPLNFDSTPVISQRYANARSQVLPKGKQHFIVLALDSTEAISKTKKHIEDSLSVITTLQNWMFDVSEYHTKKVKGTELFTDDIDIE